MYIDIYCILTDGYHNINYIYSPVIEGSIILHALSGSVSTCCHIVHSAFTQANTKLL